jgi:acetolactate synthase regulatory subunit
VDGTAFLLTVSRRIKFVTAEHLTVRAALSLSKHMTRVLEVYGRAGFRVRSILMDGEFKKLKPLMPRVECNTTAAKEHISEAERTIRTLKEQIRGLLEMLPFTYIPKRMKIEFIYFMVLWMNAFPVKSGVSQAFLPRKLLLRWWLDYKKHCKTLIRELLQCSN